MLADKLSAATITLTVQDLATPIAELKTTTEKMQKAIDNLIAIGKVIAMVAAFVSVISDVVLAISTGGTLAPIGAVLSGIQAII